MRRIFLISLLAVFLLLGFGIRQSFAQDYPPDCGDGTCDDPSESCENCVQDCGQCPGEGWEECGTGTCQDGSTFWVHCSPSCDAVPRTCYSTPSCIWPPQNCATGGCPPGQCPSTANCGPDAPEGCGVVVCNCSGGNCYSDCSGCPGPSPSPGASPEPSEPPEPPEPPECIPPTAPNLSSPANGSETPSNVILVWNPVISWGTNPDGNVNTYTVYLENNPDPGDLLCNVGSGTNFCPASGLELGTTYFWKVAADNGCAIAESEIWSFTVQAFSASSWFQTQEGDVHAQTNISSDVPSGQVFCLDGDGERPGVVSYGGGPPYFGGGDLSSTDWLVNTEFSRKRYDYFEELINRSVTPTELPCDECSVAVMEGLGSGFYKRTGGTLKITNTDGGVVDFVDKKIVILVDGSLTLEANVEMADDSGFVAFIVRQDINIRGYSLAQGGDDPDLEGVFIANNNFDLGSSTNRFIGKGIFFASSFEMSGRDLGADNDNTPAAQFVYNPSLWFNAPKELLVPSYTWEELTPESE